MLVTEMNATSYRQPAWCRYAAGFAQGKPVIVVENPYGGVGPELLPKLQDGKGYDLFRMMQYEAAALGINMSVPYGAWMGSVIEDSFWAPHDLNVEIQDFITEHERLYTTETYSEVARRLQHPERLRLGRAPGVEGEVPVLDGGRRSGGPAQPFDVVVLPEGKLREDWITTEYLARYRTLVLPGCTVLTPAQLEAIRGYLDHGGHVVATGELGANLAPSERASLLGHEHVLRTTDVLASQIRRRTTGRRGTGHRPRGQHPSRRRQGGGDPRDPLRLRRRTGRGARAPADDIGRAGGQAVSLGLRSEPAWARCTRD